MARRVYMIDYLANHPHLADEAAKNSFTEWRNVFEQRGMTLQDAIQSYRRRAQKDAIPLTLVAVKGNSLLGSASLKKADLDLRPHWTPWLAGLFVAKAFRNQGIGSALVARVVEEAKRLRFPRLYLWTPSAERLYTKLGWETLEKADHLEAIITIMSREIE